MDIDLDLAASFVATHGRVLERRRLNGLLGVGPSDATLGALDAYRNADGGYGWGLEPDLRSSTSQPVAAMHALEILAEVGDVTSARPIEVCDWLAQHSLADGGVPFALPFTDALGSAPHWVDHEPTTSSLQMTAQLAAQLHRLAPHRSDVASHAWLRTATSYCLDAIERIDDAPSTYELLFAIRFLDSIAQSTPRAATLLDRLVRYIVVDGPTPVAGGAEGEVVQLLDFTPYGGTPLRTLVGNEAIDADLNRLAAQQQADGGWTVTFASYSPAAGLEWRGYATVQAVAASRTSCAMPARYARATSHERLV